MRKSIYEDENLLLIAMLKEMRQKSGLSQVALSNKLNNYRTFVSKYESNERRLDITEIRKICKALSRDFLGFLEAYDKECEDLPRSLVRDRSIRDRL